MDVVLEQQRKSIDVNSFLDFWEVKKDKLSIVAPESANAVKIMTIHKSKGLEFPVVIFPCDVDIYKQVNPKVWLNNLPENYENFKELLLPYNKELSYVNEIGLAIYNKQREELELDNFNLLYVALTRAVEQLHVVTEKKISAKGEESTNFYSGVFINYLKQQNLWNDEELEYSFGDEKRIGKLENEKSIAETHKKFISTSWKEHNVVLLASASKLWDTNLGEAISFGNLFHEILSKIYIKDDVDGIVEQYHQEGFIDKVQSVVIKNKIEAIVYHPKMTNYFSDEVIIYNEREIIDLDNQIIIPDRLVFTDKNAVIIIDYKTGNKLKEHYNQILKYEQVLKSMNFKVDKKILIYIDNEIEVIEV